MPQKLPRWAQHTFARLDKSAPLRPIKRPGRRGSRGGLIFDRAEDFPLTCLADFIPEGWITVQRG